MNQLLERILLESGIKPGRKAIWYKLPDVCFCQDSDYLTPDGIDELLQGVEFPEENRQPSPSGFRPRRRVKKSKHKLCLSKKEESKGSSKEVFFDCKNMKWVVSIRPSRNLDPVTSDFKVEKYVQRTTTPDFTWRY